MNRQAKIFFLTHLYPVYIVCHMQFGDWGKACTAIFNIVPIFFLLMLVQVWIRTSNIRLCDNEKRSLYLFIYFFMIAHLYYATCAIIGGTIKGDIWIIKHNLYFVYFAIFITIFYILNYSVKRKGN